MSLHEIRDLEFPDYPAHLTEEDELRGAYAKAGAYVTFALEKSSIEHSRSQMAATVTESARGLPRQLPVEKLLERAIGELATAELESPDESFTQELTHVRRQLERVQESVK